MKDELHELNKFQRDLFLLFPVLPSGLFSDFIYSHFGEKEGTVKGLYTPHSWRLIGLIISQCPACEKMPLPILNL